VPPLELALQRVAPPEGADRPAKEIADLAPAVAQQAPGERQHRPYVQVPERASETFRYAELERGDEATRTHHAREFGQRRSRLADVAQEVREREVIKGPGVERERLRRRVDQLDLATEAAVCHRQHPGALIDSGDAEPPPPQLGRDEAGPGRHVENVPAARQARGEEAPPAWVLSQREHRAHAVVRRPQRCEEFARLLFQAPR
jgi:hypothetical protein